MHVYTYHEPVQGLEDPPLLDLWDSSWRRFGFTPVVLGRADAEKHPRYAEILRSSPYFAGTGRNNPAYQLATVLRWAAFACAPTPWVLAADWDVINVGFRWESEPEIVNFGDQCPDLVVFSPHDGAHLCPAATFCTRVTADHVLSALLNAASVGIPYAECHDEDILRHAPHGVPIRHVRECPNRTAWYGGFSNPRLIHFSNGTTPPPRSATIRSELQLP